MCCGPWLTIGQIGLALPHTASQTTHVASLAPFLVRVACLTMACYSPRGRCVKCPYSTTNLSILIGPQFGRPVAQTVLISELSTNSHCRPKYLSCPVCFVLLTRICVRVCVSLSPMCLLTWVPKPLPLTYTAMI